MAEEIGAGTRRLPVYLMLDCSGSMAGEPIEAVRMGLRSLLSDLKSDPQALETVWMSIITFDSSAKQLSPLTEIGTFQEPTIDASGSTAMGEALKLVGQCIEKEVRKTTASQKGDWKPLVFLMTDGQPTDSWEKPADELKKRKPANVIACAAGPGADDSALKRITETVVRLQDTSPGALGAFMKWVTASIKTTSASVSAGQGDQAVNLPALPQGQEIQMVP